MKLLIVGGVAGGASAATRARRLDETMEIIIFERTGYISYATCGLPYYIGGEIKAESSLSLNSPESFKNRFNIDVRTLSDVIAVNPDRKTITVKNLATNLEYEESYDKLVLSPGAKPIRPDLKGIHKQGIFALRTLTDSFAIKEFINETNPQTAVIVGGGFIGLEMAENLINLGIETTIVERHDHILKTLDYEMACYLQGVIKNRGINIFVNATVKGFEERNGRIYTIFEEDIPIQTDLIILALGVVPDTDFLAGSGIELSIKNAIIVNEHMETSITDIYAVGDAVEVKNFVTGKKNLVPLAGPANKQGRIVANNICGINSSYKGSLGSAIIKLFDYTVATTGITEKQAMEENIDYNKVIVIPPSHASYYPEAKNLVAKVVFESGTGRILGAQIVGEDGVDKRCDIFATAIKAKMTAEDLADLEVCYAPPYSSAKDLVNMAGFTMENVLAGRLKQIHFDDVDNLDRKYYFILDVRNRDEFAQGHIRKAVNIPLDELRENIDKIDKRKIICINCKTGVRSYIAYCMLTQMGFDCLNLSGGFLFYRGVLDGRFDIGYNNFESGIRIATKD